MATINPFDLLVDDDTDDISQLAAKAPAAQTVAKSAQPAKPAAKVASKPLPPAQAVRESKFDGPRGGGRGGNRGAGRGRGGGRGFNRDSADGENTFGENTFARSNGYSGGYGGAPEDGEAGKTTERRGYGAPRVGFRGSRRGGYSNGDAAEGERPRRGFERRSGTGYGNEVKREGAGRGNWGTPSDDIAPETEIPVTEPEKVVETEKEPGQDDAAADANKDAPANEPEAKEPEEKEMTLEEYEKVLEEKRQALLASKPEERKVVLDKELKSMQLLSCKKNNDEIFAKLGADKDKKKEVVTEKAKKVVSINEFLKPAEGENNYRSGGGGRGGRGGGRARGRGGSGGGGYGGNNPTNVPAPSIQDVGQFPSLGGK